MKKMFAAAAAAAMVLGTSAQANSAQSLSLTKAPRAASSVEESNEAVGGFLIPLIAIVAVVVGVVVIADDSDSN